MSKRTTGNVVTVQIRVLGSTNIKMSVYLFTVGFDCSPMVSSKRAGLLFIMKDCDIKEVLPQE